MRKMLKKVAMIALCAMLVSCGGNEGTETKNQTTKESSVSKSESESEKNKDNESIDGFIKAEHDKFNSYAEDNGLGGTLVYIEGKILNKTLFNNTETPGVSLVVEQDDGKRWCVLFPSDSEMDGIEKEQARIFGQYRGFSDVANLPAIVVSVEEKDKYDKARIEIVKNGKYETVWNFLDYTIQKTESESKEESKPQSSAASTTPSGSGDVEILAEYTYSDGIGWYTYHFMVIKNNTDKTVDVSTSSLAYGKDGSLVGADDADFDALGSGCVSVIYEAFEVDVEIDHYETELSFSKSKYYESVIQDLSYEQNNIDKGAVFKVTNNGDKAARFVEGYALFFLNGELVSFDSTYFTDDDLELKPMKSISKQITSYDNYDTIEFYLTGRRR